MLEPNNTLTTIEQINNKMLSIHRKHKNILENIMESYGVTSLQLHILFRIYQNKNIQISQLAKQVKVHPSSLTKILDHLVKLDLVSRNYGKNDRRIVMVRLTENGSQLISQTIKKHSQSLTKYYVGFSEPELTSLLQLLEKLDRRIGATKTEAANHLEI